MSAAQLETWFLETTKRNKVLASGSDAKITDPFNPTDPNFQPMSGSPVLSASYWSVTPVIDYEKSISNITVRNYPNPFTGITNIELDMSKSADVNIMVVNISGAVISNLQHGKLSEGTYRFTFDATQLPTGVYIGKVMIDKEVHTLKMIAR
jgi:hypothetical protein